MNCPDASGSVQCKLIDRQEMGLGDVGQGDVLRNEWPGIILNYGPIIRFVLFDQIRRWHNDRPKSLAVLEQRSTLP